MPCAIEKHVMVKLSVHVNVIDVFHDVNSVLYSVTNFTSGGFKAVKGSSSSKYIEMELINKEI